MAKSKFEYVRNFEQQDECLYNTWIVVRLDGRGFHKFTDAHHFTKPNDLPGLNLMNKCGMMVMNEFQDIVMAYGQSDEYREIQDYLEEEQVPLQYPPTFDSRVVLYPSDKNLRDYLSWRQADCHINNLYNTCFWSLIKSGLDSKEAEKRLCKTEASQKHDILFNEFSINYNHEPEQFKKGSVLIWEAFFEQITQQESLRSLEMEETQSSLCKQEGKGSVLYRKRKRVVCSHVDIIGDCFWEQHEELLLL